MRGHGGQIGQKTPNLWTHHPSSSSFCKPPSLVGQSTTKCLDRALVSRSVQLPEMNPVHGVCSLLLVTGPSRGCSTCQPHLLRRECSSRVFQVPSSSSFRNKTALLFFLKASHVAAPVLLQCFLNLGFRCLRSH